jgi:hypothetical protein
MAVVVIPSPSSKVPEASEVAREQKRLWHDVPAFFAFRLRHGLHLEGAQL